MTGKLDRRQVLKLEAAAMAAAAGGMASPAAAANLVTERAASELKWDKAACRFCGTGCSVMVATKENRVVATHGDIKSEVNRGLNCVKGYFLSKIMYGHDRLTQPMLRKRNGAFDKNGEFTPVSWDEAFTVMAEKFKAALKKQGPSGVGMFGSGQWTVWEGYAAAKLFKAGFRTNNLDPNARHCMASAVAGFMRTFGIDEPMGCYDDIEAADAFVLWGSNMAEMHPLLWTRVTDRRLSAPHVRVAVLSTFEHRSFDLADLGLVFKPQTDLAILNAIANHIIKTGRVNKEFVARHTVFKRGQTDIGYGLRPEHPLQKAAKGAAKANDATDMTFEEYARFVADYTIEKAAEISGVPANRIEALAELYADPKIKVTSFWTMGFNQHTRGVWCNNLAIVQRLANTLGHKVTVQSTPGKGSGFCIVVPLGREKRKCDRATALPPNNFTSLFSGRMLVIEDEGSVRAALESWLRSEGLEVVSVVNGIEALALTTEKGMRFDFVLSDYNLPGHMNGIDSIHALRAAVGWKIPAIVLTGDMRTGVLESIARHNVAIALKPVDTDKLMDMMRSQLPGIEARPDEPVALN